MKILLIYLSWISLLWAKEDSYLEELASQYPYVRQLVHAPLAKWPNHDIWGSIDARGAQGIALAVMKSNTLKSLNLSFCQLTDETIKPILLSLVNHPCLEKINLRGNNIRQDSIKLLTQVLRNNWSLKSLDISLTTCTPQETTDLFEAIYQSETIKEVIFDANIFPLEAAKKLGELTVPNQSLERLSFSMSCFSSVVLRHFADHAGKLKALKRLDLSRNILTNEDAATLAELVYNCPSLEEIEVTENKTNFLFCEEFYKKWTSFESKKRNRKKPLILYWSRSPKSQGSSSQSTLELKEVRLI